MITPNISYNGAAILHVRLFEIFFLTLDSTRIASNRLDDNNNNDSSLVAHE